MRSLALLVQVAILCWLSVGAYATSPDDWGYRYLTSQDVGGPVFSWRDISLAGQYVPLLDDDNEGPFYLGFQFPSYETERGSIFVCSNGWASFTSTSHQFNHFRIPSVREPNCLVAPFWTDLDPAAAGSVFVYQDVNEFVICWQSVPHRRGVDGFTFQAVLRDDSTLLFQYLAMTDSLHIDSSSVGIEDGEGKIGLCFFRDGEPSGALEDSLAVLFFTVDHDVNPSLIHSPLDRIFTGVPCTPRVSIKNYGSSPEAPTVVCTARDSTTLLPVYSDTVTVANIEPRDTSLVSFRDWVPVEGTVLIEFTTELSVNDDATLDTLTAYVHVSTHADMAFDDGVPEGWYIVSGSPVSIMGVAVRFLPPYAPYNVIRGKIYVSDTLPFEEVFLAPDNGSGVPDLDDPYCVVEQVRASEETTWAFADFDMTIQSNEDVWLAAIWPRGAVGPLVGEDITPPIDSCSYFTVYPPMWSQRTACDLLMRIEIDDNVGISEENTPALGRGVTLSLAPNPVTRETEIKVNLPLELSCRKGVEPCLEIYDLAGRLVKSIELPSGGSTIRWNGEGSGLGRLPSGSYFVVLTTHRGVLTEKAILLD